MRIIISSDIHDNLDALKNFFKYIKEIVPDVFFFCGDFVSPFTVSHIARNLPKDTRFFAVFGNNEGDKDTIAGRLRENDRVISLLDILEIDKKKVLILHGFGSIEKTEKVVISFLKSRDYDIILFGHTHKPKMFKMRKEDGIIEHVEVLDVLSNQPNVTYEVDLEKFVLAINPGELGGWLTGLSTFVEMLITPQNNNVKVIFHRL